MLPGALLVTAFLTLLSLAACRIGFALPALSVLVLKATTLLLPGLLCNRCLVSMSAGLGESCAGPHPLAALCQEHTDRPPPPGARPQFVPPLGHSVARSRVLTLCSAPLVTAVPAASKAFPTTRVKSILSLPHVGLVRIAVRFISIRVITPCT